MTLKCITSNVVILITSNAVILIANSFIILQMLVVRIVPLIFIVVSRFGLLLLNNALFFNFA